MKKYAFGGLVALGVVAAIELCIWIEYTLATRGRLRQPKQRW